jgi:hypothetical protein
MAEVISAACAEVFDPTQEVMDYHGRFSMREQETTIWMDGRPLPPDYARHSWSGSRNHVSGVHRQDEDLASSEDSCRWRGAWPVGSISA